MKKLKILVIISILIPLITLNTGVAGHNKNKEDATGRDCSNPKNYFEKLKCKKDAIFHSNESKSEKTYTENTTAENTTTENATTGKLQKGSKSLWKKFKNATRGIREIGGKNIGEPG